MKRRTFIRKSALATAGLGLSSTFFKTGNLFAQTYPDVVWVENGEPQDLLKSALSELGGLSRFINKGENIVIKPNIGWDRSPELAANTNPDLIYALVKECFAAGANSVKIFDRTCNNPRRCYRNSDIERRAEEAGAEVSHIRDSKFKNITINGRVIKEWPIYEDYLEADKVINIPIAKHHGMARVTLGLKNLMGVMGGNRGSLHNNFPQKMADINKHILPTLTIIDAYRILLDSGPSGGDPDDVEVRKTLIASSCTVAADYTALELFGHTLDDVEYIKVAAEQGLGKCDLKNLNLKRVRLA